MRCLPDARRARPGPACEELHRHAARRLLKARARRCEIYVQGERDGQATILEIDKHVLAEERENARALSYGDAWG